MVKMAKKFRQFVDGLAVCYRIPYAVFLVFLVSLTPEVLLEDR